MITHHLGYRSPLRFTLVLALATTFVVGLSVVHQRTASADTCFTWNRTLRTGTSGEDVRQLQIRLGGWAGYKNHLEVDGYYGSETRAAVERFQSHYGLPTDGVAGPATFSNIYALQDSNCTPAHFSYSEFEDDCYGGFSGGPVSESTVRRGLRQVMWKLEALRAKIGDVPLIVASGFRGQGCNASVGGASNSQHLYGTAGDVSSPYTTYCTIAQNARTSGFSGIIGPGSPDGEHEDHVHLDTKAQNNHDGLANSYYWSAPSCGIPTQY